MIALALTLLLPLGAACCAPQREGSDRLLYRVTGGKSELYLLGSTFWMRWKPRMCWPLSATPKARRHRPPIGS